MTMKILLVQTSYMGDVVLSTPVIAGLKSLHPESELWVMTTPQAAPLIAVDPMVKGVITFDKRAAERSLSGLLAKSTELKGHHFDRAYSLHRSARTTLMLRLAGIGRRIGFKEASLSFFYHDRPTRSGQRHAVLRNLAILSAETELQSLPSDLRLFVAPENSLAKSLPSLGKNYILLVPGSAWKTKMWHWSGYRELVEHYLSKGQTVVVAGVKEDKQICDQICAGTKASNLAGELGLSGFVKLVSQAGLVFCNDSLALHITSAFKVPTVAIFCATSPAFGFGPWRNPKAVVVEKSGLWCKPCRPHGGNRCPSGTESCMRDLSTSEVLAAASGVLEQ